MKRWIGLLTCLVLLAACVFAAVAVTNTPARAALPTLDDLFHGDAAWRYTDDPVQLSRLEDSSWTLPGFDDADWLTSGQWSFGAEHGRLEELSGDFLPDVCLRQYMPNGRNIPTFCFRLQFTARAEDRESEILIDLAYDDAVIVYLNGKEVFSENVPEEGYEELHSYGSADVPGAPARTSFTLDAALLAEGENVLAFELHQDNDDSSDVYFAVESMGSRASLSDALRNETLCLGVGADETSVLVTWRGPAGETAYVQATAGETDEMPEHATRYEAAAVYVDDDVCTYRAALTGLKPGTYTYRAVDQRPSAMHTFTVREAGDSFSFLCHGDPQIGRAEDESPIETYDALAEMAAGDDPMQFVLSLGDQADHKEDTELFRRFTSASLIKRLPLAPVVGNHEFHSDVFSRFFFMPNMDESTMGDSGDMSGDYWFFRGNTLFFCLNSDRDDVESHRAFMRTAREACVERYGEPAWTIAAMHYSMFSQGQHSTDGEIRNRREDYAEAFEEAGVCAVFSGHDHIYTRSWPMDGDTPIVGGESWEGVVYFCLSSSTGTKFYDFADEDYDYVAMCDDSEYPCMTRVDVTQDTLTVTTYQDRDGSLTVLDAYQIEKPTRTSGAERKRERVWPLFC